MSIISEYSWKESVQIFQNRIIYKTMDQIDKSIK